MIAQHLQINYQTFTTDAQLEAQQLELLQAARSVALQAYNPYSQFFVGCAILLANNKIVTGFNIENAAYSVCICAERTTLSAALTQYPNIKIVSLAVSVYQHNQPNDVPAFPCGVCRQFISECEDINEQNITIMVGGQTGLIHQFESIKQLLPFSFGKKNLIK
jgi:cytidine deaminase